MTGIQVLANNLVLTALALAKFMARTIVASLSFIAADKVLEAKNSRGIAQ